MIGFCSVQVLNEKRDWIQGTWQVLQVSVQYQPSLRDFSVVFLKPPFSIFKDTFIKGNLKFDSSIFGYGSFKHKSF